MNEPLAVVLQRRATREIEEIDAWRVASTGLALPWILHSAHEQDAPVRRVADEKQERVVDGHALRLDDWPGR